MPLPDPLPVSAAVGQAIAARHGLTARSLTPLPQVGIINTIFFLGDKYVLRVPRQHPAHIAQARTEAIAAPAAHAAGVRTPRLIAFDDACDLLPVPYLITERLRGETLGLLLREPHETPQVWHELGRDLALLHRGVTAASPAGQLRREQPLPDPRTLAEERASDGWITALEVHWLTTWLDRLASATQRPVPERFLHLDVQATNVLVTPGTHDYLSLLDWGCAGWGDPAWDFFGLPLRAVPAVLAGHRTVAPLDGDDTAEARILWRHLQFVLAILPRGAAPGMSWGERPLAWLLDIMHFFLDTPGGVWRDLRP